MQTKTIVFTLGLCMLAFAESYAAESPNMGTWKLSEAKSKFGRGRQGYNRRLRGRWRQCQSHHGRHNRRR